MDHRFVNEIQSERIKSLECNQYAREKYLLVQHN